MLSILKIFILFLIFVVCTFLGFTKAKSYDVRVEELKRIKNALEAIKSKIEFTYEPIMDIFTEITKMIYQKNSENNIFKDTVKLSYENGITESWNMAVDKETKLTGEDKSILKMFGKLLGKIDKEGQINEINVTSNLLDTQIEKAEQEKKKNYKLFKTLGSVIGIGLCIILI